MSQQAGHNKATRAATLDRATSDGLHKALRRGGLGDFTAKSDVAGCLLPLLAALGWRGSDRALAEALPHFADSLSIDDLRNVLATLSYKTLTRSIAKGGAIDPRVLPCLFIPASGSACVLLQADENGLHGHDGATGQDILLAPGSLEGTLFLIAELDRAEEEKAETTANWFGTLVRRFRGTVSRLIGLSLLLNLFALATPLFIMAVYDQVIPARNGNVLVPLGIGIALVFVFEVAIRTVRARMVAFMAGRMDHLIATSVVRQILSLPASMTETAPLGGQVARIREFDNLRDIFTGTLTTVLLEAPFALLFVAVIAVIAGPLAVIPLGMMALFAALAFAMAPLLKRTVEKSSKTRAEKHSFMVEMISQLRTIKEANAEDTWTRRHRELSAAASLANHETTKVSFLFQSIAQSIMLIAGGACVGFGVLLVLEDRMSVGALVATMALIWRVLSPLHNLFLTLTKAEQMKSAVQQMNQLMKLPPEEKKGFSHKVVSRQWQGRIGFNRVSFRYGPLADPALLGVSFSAEPGEMIAIMGTNGAGKSTILKLALGLHRPQAGQITIDGLDLRQVDPSELRRAITYAPQQISMFHGTIAQNLRLADPTASEDRLYEACDLAGILPEIDRMPDGLATRFGDQSFWQLNAGFRQRLALARCFLRPAPIMLLDEPGQSLDNDGDAALMAALKRLKGTATILMVSHRPSHVRLADRALVLDGGTLMMAGRPDDVYAQLPGGSL